MTHRACLAGVTVGDDLDVAIIGVLNVSPESFYQGSVVRESDVLVRAAEGMARAGAAILDVGAMSTAPYLATRIAAEEEADRLCSAIAVLRDKVDLPISADTSRRLPARAALEAGARIINDVTGLRADAELGPLVAQAGAGLIAMASERDDGVGARPIEVVLGLLRESLELARRAGVPEDTIVLDPGIGFFREQGVSWYDWDCQVLSRLERLRALGRPLCLAVSRKSFVGALTGEQDPARRLPGSLAATAAAVLAGAQLIRTHDVPETMQAVKVASAIRRARDR